VSANEERAEAVLRAQLGRISRSRDRIVKAWLVEVIRDSSLAEIEQLPMSWAAGELPQLISDVLAAIGDAEDRPKLGEDELMRVSRFAELRGAAASPSQVAREVSLVHIAVLSSLREQLQGADPDLLGEAAERLASLFGELNSTAVGTLFESSDPGRDPVTGMYRTRQMKPRLEQMVAAAKRYGHPFALVLFDVEGPGTREEPSNSSGREAVLAVVSAALRGSIRMVDEAFRLDEDELCLLAPNQTAADATLMAHRLSSLLARLEEAGGLRITVSAGVAACPEHGDEPERLLRQADTAMWRARATGQSVTIGALQDS
jgi:diguanylate cyclase (GGDEF)-like protein